MRAHVQLLSVLIHGGVTTYRAHNSVETNLNAISSDASQIGAMMHNYASAVISHLLFISLPTIPYFGKLRVYQNELCCSPKFIASRGRQKLKIPMQVVLWMRTRF